MVTLNEAQVWTVIGILGATLVGTIGVITQILMRTITAQFNSLQTQLGIVQSGIQGQLAGLQTQIGGIESRLDRLESRFDGLDRDVQAISRRVFPGGTP